MRGSLRAILTLFVVMLWCVVAALVLPLSPPPRPAETTSDTVSPTDSLFRLPPLPYCVNGEVGAQWEHPQCQFRRIET